MADDWAFPEQPARWDEMTPECKQAWSEAFNGDPANPDPTKRTRLTAVPLHDHPLSEGVGDGSGQYRAPAAPVPIGEAEHEPLSPPLTPSEGGGASLLFAQATADGSGGTVSAKAIQFKADVSASPNFEQTGDAFSAKYFKL